ncbi:MAG: SH3 domain-containing protein [Bacteroidota bacterium]
MKRKPLNWILCLTMLLLGGVMTAQTSTDPFQDTEDEVLRRRNRDKIFYEDGVIYERTEAKGHSIVAYQNIRLYKKPGRGSEQSGTVLFTEELRHLGMEGYVKSDGHNYIYVKTSRGKKGWVQSNYVVQNGGVVVLTETMPIYETPNSRGTVTEGKFEAGEIVILDDFQNGWVHLTNKRKENIGWIQGYDKLSLESADIEAAALYAEALKIPEKERRKTALQTITQGRGQDISPEMALVIDDAIRATEPKPIYTNPNPDYKDDFVYYPNGEDGLSSDASNLGDFGENSNAGSINYPSATPLELPAEQKYNAYVEKVVDRETGRYYNRVIETGGIQPVKAKKPANIYYCYHKTLPIGSTILLEVPGTGAYVQLEVIARLRADNANIVGLGGDLIKKVYGEISAKNVYAATIVYPQQ